MAFPTPKLVHMAKIKDDADASLLSSIQMTRYVTKLPARAPSRWIPHLQTTQILITFIAQKFIVMLVQALPILYQKRWSQIHADDGR